MTERVTSFQSGSSAPPGRLALAFQETFTVIARVRDGRQVPRDAGSFRTRIKALLGQADEEARRIGYPSEFVRLSVYSVVALLDETVLGTEGPVSSAWAGRPMQEEVFGDHVAGENFFKNLKDLLSRQDSTYVADVVEVLLLCMQLGFKGRYSSTDAGDLREFRRAAREKIRRIRGEPGRLSPWALPPSEEEVPSGGDSLLRKLSLAVLGTGVAVLALVLALRFLSLSSGIEETRALVEQVLS